MRFFKAAERVPEKFLSRIKGGNLSGKHSIDPQWRIRKLTELFGPCGQGWKVEVVRLWSENGPDGAVAAFCQVNLYWRESPADPWSDPVPGIGGNRLVQKFSRGLNLNDEAYKMAMTDAISVACKALGVGSLVYEGAFDGDKYQSSVAEASQVSPQIEELRLRLSQSMSYPDVLSLVQDAQGLSQADREILHDEALKVLSQINEADFEQLSQILGSGEVPSDIEKSLASVSPSVRKRLATRFAKSFPDLFKGL